MKDVVFEEVVKELNWKEKVFTKNQTNIIISSEYNPLNKDEGFYEREGLFMKETKEVILKEVMEELIISKEDFKNYFNGRKIINKKEYQEYLKTKK